MLANLKYTCMTRQKTSALLYNVYVLKVKQMHY